MSYNMWFLTPEPKTEPAGRWIRFVAEITAESDSDAQRAELAAGTAKNWRQLSVTYPDGDWSFDFERYSVGTSGPWTDDLDFFYGWLDRAEPAVNAQWVKQYLAGVKTVYLFRCSNGAPDSNLELVREIVDSMRHEGPGGLLYAEFEGWSNENGQHVTWEFSDRVTGPWWMALREAGGWRYFEMELGNRGHRRAFKAGRVPDGVESEFYTD